MKIKAVIDEGVGETRCAVYEGKKLVEIYIRRWSGKDGPRLGDIFAGKLTKIDKSMGGAFVDLGAQPHGLLKFTNAQGAPRLTEGQMIKVEITREGTAKKGPVLKFVDVTDLSKPQPLVQITLEDMLKRRFGPDLKIEYANVNHVEDAVSREIALPGGGDICIERTRALVAIDVDRGTAMNGFEVCLQAASVAADQIRLRGLGGLIVIDFPNLRQPKQRDRLYKAMQDAVKDDPNIIKVAPLSRFGAIEMTRAVQTRSLDEQFADKTETGAMLALRRLEREAAANPGAQLVLSVPHYIFHWLENDLIDWKDAMTNKIGGRFRLRAGNVIEVSSDR